MTQERRCFDCGAVLVKSLVDHPYRYDHGAPVELRAIVKWSCACGYHEVEIPRMGPLHEAISEALLWSHVKREDLVFFFDEGSRGVEDGAWYSLARRSVDQSPGDR